MNSSLPRLEVIVTDAAEARVSAACGAHRLELISAWDLGGLTPSFDVVEEVLEAVRIPVHVMLRPHAQSFVYDAADRERVLRDAARLRELRVHAIVFGALTPEGAVDLALLRDVARAAPGVQITFHRAFDRARDAHAAHAQLRQIPEVTRVLSSGHAADAWSGRALLAQLVAQHPLPAMLPGGGINAENAAALIDATGARELHAGSGARTNGAIDPAKIAGIIDAMEGAASRSVRLSGS